MGLPDNWIGDFMADLLSMAELASRDECGEKLTEKQRLRLSIYNEFKAFIGRGGVPVLEYPIVGDECLTVWLSVNSAGVFFSFDDLELPVYFDGEVKRYSDGYIVPFDVFTDKLDSYLQIIDGNITEGFILPNDLSPAD